WRSFRCLSADLCISLVRRPPAYTRIPYTSLCRSRRRRCTRRRRDQPGTAQARARHGHHRHAVPLAAAVQPHRCPYAARRLPPARSEEHTSELQSRENLVCRLLLEKKNKKSLKHLE